MSCLLTGHLAASGADASVLKHNLESTFGRGRLYVRARRKLKRCPFAGHAERRLVMLRGREPSRSIAKCSNGRQERK